MRAVNRKITFKLYPNKTQALRMDEMRQLHQRLYNAALEQRIDAYKRCGISLSLRDQCRELTQLRAQVAEYKALNAQSSQVTLKRLDLAFKAFFERVKRSEKAGFPRFKSLSRFKGWGYKSHGDGFRVLSDGHHGKIRLSGVGELKMRGKARQWGEVKTCEIVCKRGDWYASLTIECEPKRECGNGAVGMDWGVSTFATLVTEEGEVTKIENPRHLKNKLEDLKTQQRRLSRKKLGSKGWWRLKKRLAATHAKVVRQRQNFLHQTSAHLVAQYGLIATEKLNVRSMTQAGNSKSKKGLNREILATAPARFISMLQVKAEEAGLVWHQIETRKVKPSQTCPRCGAQRKKALWQRIHTCQTCGCTMDRDAASALVMLHHTLYGQPTGREPALSGAVQLCLC